MKRIGQLTFHASHNYGSVLQAYALSKQLELMGYETEYINLRPESQEKLYRIIRKYDRGVHKLFRYFIYPILKKRHKNFERFINNVLPLTRKRYMSTEEMKKTDFGYDAYVCGGDQIWNPACEDFETAYYLQFLPKEDKSKKISYAPSLGKTSFDSDALANISQWIQKFDYISVREEQGAELLRTYTEKEVQVVCDPVVLLDKEEWKKLAVMPKFKKPYILVYFLDNNHGSRELIPYLKEKTGYDVVILNEYIREFFKPYHKAYGASPEEFVGLFMNASFIYTNSFHGTVFATLFEKPFLTAIAVDQNKAENNNDSRKINYLEKIGLGNRLYTKEIPDIDKLLEIDYSSVRKKIADFRELSLDYLKRALENS